MAYNPIDILEGILLFYPDEEFINDREMIHTAFYELKKLHAPLLNQLIFRENLLFPRSRMLDESLASLQPDFLGKINPTYDTYTIKKENLKMHWKTELQDILKDLEPQLKEIAVELKASLQNA